MFNTANDCYAPSPSSPGLIFNRSHQNSRYHPYNRVSTSFYSNNELDSYNFDNGSNNTSTNHHHNSHHHQHHHHHHAHHGQIPNYDPSNLAYEYNLAWSGSSSSMDHELGIDVPVNHTGNLGGTGAPRCFKRRVSANKKERRRTQSINTAFSDLRTAIPNVQPDTKLSKIKTLKLATKYIEFLMDILAKDDPTAMPSAFKAEIIKTRKDHRDLMKFDHTLSPRKIKGRTGWPQAVWQSELNRNENFHQHSQSNNDSHPSPSIGPMTGHSSSSLPMHTSAGSLSNSPTLSHASSSSSTKASQSSSTKLRSHEKSYMRNNNEKMR